MLNIFLALWLAFAYPTQHTNRNNSGTTVNINAESDPGDNGHVPPPPPGS
ncbi:hypothetical protein ACFFGT_10345 [Mucilaginibacter angelicae]|uniref:Uncharacterized protein n=1 Tax=Mucilaginibacter angelicae TaxID=869718 RepID=A0ABV6L577_9SPHI